MLSKSLVAQALLQIFSRTVLDVTPIYALPTGEPVLRRSTDPPGGDYSPQWQKYFQVTDPLPGINFTLGNNYAGNIAVQRPQYPDDSLFFWGFEKSPGSLTAPACQGNGQPWAIWLQGGPGDSSMLGLFTENGPIHLQPNSHQLSQNPYAWNNLIDYIWVDQPVGVGFATTNVSGFAANEDQVGTDFVGFLENLVKVFPSLATRPFYLTGESYAGRYIPYIAKAIFSSPEPPVKLTKLSVGDPAFGKVNEFKTMPTLRLIETYPQLIAYDTDVFDYFKQQTHLCKLDLNLTYPQTGGHFPSIRPARGAKPGLLLPSNNAVTPFVFHNTRRSAPVSPQGFVSEVHSRYVKRSVRDTILYLEEREKQQVLWKKEIATLANNTINPWYGCFLYDEIVDYALNFTYPWNMSQRFDDLDVPNALNPRAARNPGFFLNDDQVKAALHAPPKDWVQNTDYPWGSVAGRSDPSLEPMTFFNQLAANASARGVKIITYVGNDDGISPHFGTEVTIQNTTFGGIQGFTRQPSTPWFDDDGLWAGIVHQERNWTYALVYGAGHEVPGDRPPAAYTFLREFIIGDNQTGLVVTEGDSEIVIGGENPTLKQSAIPGQPGIAYGSKTTQGVYSYPTDTVNAFEKHIGFVTITGTDAITVKATAAV